MQVLEVLKGLSEDKVHREDLNYLIELSKKIAKAYLIRNYTKISKISAFIDISIEEAALDSIAELFSEKTPGRNYEIVNSFLSWKPSVNSEPEALYFLNKITAASVEQYISGMLRDSDPFFSKIYNSVNYFLKKQGYFKVIYAGTKYIVKNNSGQFSRQFIDLKTFENIPSKYFLSRQNFLSELFSYIENNTNLEPAIPFNILVLRLKKIYLSSAVNDYPENNLEIRLNVDEAINSALDVVTNLMKTKYYAADKFSDNEIKYFTAALTDMSRDLKDGGLNPGLMKYLTRYIPDLDRTGKLEKYHNILEYLVKLLKKEIAENLKEINE